MYDAVAGYGPLQRHLDDPQVEEIWINERLPGGSCAVRSAASAAAGQHSVAVRGTFALSWRSVIIATGDRLGPRLLGCRVSRP